MTVFILAVLALLAVLLLFLTPQIPSNVYRKPNPNNIEKYIASVVKSNPHPNIVTVYEVNDDYIEMEKLTTNCGGYSEDDLNNARMYFMSNNIAYLDWTEDNFGKDAQGKTKVYDFNFSGLMNSDKASWRVEPWPGRVYIDSKNAGCKTPIEFEEYSFKNKNLWV
jgi:hypothetical protein